ncbi:MAG: TMEM43 family protein [Sandaracinus sp.]|nr:TMEM43 family protein [Sandaracinus sp.]MCB9612114.1 TMEM43 family protein [Sandaracinus sp.]MCB9623474.1 TMEM43 family protein [Sandaracinus sp.]
MSDRFVRTESVGWLSRLGESIKGVLVGLLFFFGSFPLLFWNEGRAVRRAQDLEEGRGAVVEAQADTVDPSMEGRLVHLNGLAVTSETLADPRLGVSAPPSSLRLRRSVEMYQWQEESRTRESKNLGGGQTRRTTYTYRTEWSAAPIDASRFEERAGHENPPMPFESTTVEAHDARIGARRLDASHLTQLDTFVPLPVAPAAVPALAAFGRPVQPEGQGVFVGANLAAPQVGDLRVRWEVVPAGPASVLAAQRGDGFGAWRTPSGRELEANVELGVASADQMFGELEAGNATLTWILRFVGWLLMFLGLNLIFRPLVTVADVVPLLGNLIGAGFFLAALVLSIPLSLTTIAVGWIVYRPLVGAALLAVGLAIGFGFGALARKRGRAKNEVRHAARG